MGYKDASIAKTRWSQIRKKKMGGDASGGGVTKSSPTKTSNTPKKAVAAKDEGSLKSPRKSGRKPVKKAVYAEEEGADDDGESGANKDREDSAVAKVKEEVKLEAEGEE